MRHGNHRFATLAAGIVVGVTLVVSCGDKVERGAAAPPDMAIEGGGGSSGTGGGSCGTCAVNGPIAVSSVAQPVTVQASQALPVTGSVAVSEPITVSSITSPVTVAGVVKVLTADSDAAQLKSGFFGTTGTNLLLLGKGPFVITDAQLDGTALSNFVATIYIDAGTSCPASESAATPRIRLTPTAPLHGARLFVPAGYVACGNGNAAMFSGFSPY